jgi:N-acylneuraminate cytidylyltransferase
LFCSDVDGCLTDNGVYYSAKGEEIKKFNMSDGQGIELLKKAGIEPIIITQENSKIVLARARKLRIKAYVGIKDKLYFLQKLVIEKKLKSACVAYVGNDVNDIGAMKFACLSFAPADAIDEVKKIATMVLNKKGGEGCVREAIDWLLKEPRSV